jgi:membrane protease YdiL (CAAX protease family)
MEIFASFRGRVPAKLWPMLSPKPWRLDAVLQLLAGIFACTIAGALFASLLHHERIAGFRSEEGLGVILLGTLSLHGAALVLIHFFLREHEVSWRSALGWGLNQFKRVISPVVLTIFFILPVAGTLQMLLFGLLTKLGHPPQEQEAVELFSKAGSNLSLAYLIFFAVILAPVAEEFIFRGILYPFVKQLGYPKLALIGVSLLFASVHGSLVILLPLFVFALAQTWLYEKTDCLLAPMITHAVFNLANLVVMFAARSVAQPNGVHS